MHRGDGPSIPRPRSPSRRQLWPSTGYESRAEFSGTPRPTLAPMSRRGEALHPPGPLMPTEPSPARRGAPPTQAKESVPEGSQLLSGPGLEPETLPSSLKQAGHWDHSPRATLGSPRLSLVVPRGPACMGTAFPVVTQPHSAAQCPPLGSVPPRPLTQPPLPPLYARPAQLCHSGSTSLLSMATGGPSQDLELGQGDVRRHKATVQEVHRLPCRHYTPETSQRPQVSEPLLSPTHRSLDALSHPSSPPSHTLGMGRALQRLHPADRKVGHQMRGWAVWSPGAPPLPLLLYRPCSARPACWGVLPLEHLPPHQHCP